MAERSTLPGAGNRAPSTPSPHDQAAQAEREAAERLLGDALYLGTDAVHRLILLTLAEVIREVIRTPKDDRTQERIGEVTLVAARTIVHASALAVGRNIDLVRKGGRHG